MTQKKLRRYTPSETATINELHAAGESAAAILKVIRRTRKGTTLAAITSQIWYQQNKGKRRAKVTPLRTKLSQGIKLSFLRSMLRDHGKVTIQEFAEACTNAGLTNYTLADISEVLS